MVEEDAAGVSDAAWGVVSVSCLERGGRGKGKTGDGDAEDEGSIEAVVFGKVEFIDTFRPCHAVVDVFTGWNCGAGNLCNGMLVAVASDVSSCVTVVVLTSVVSATDDSPFTFTTLK